MCGIIFIAPAYTGRVEITHVRHLDYTISEGNLSVLNKKKNNLNFKKITNCTKKKALITSKHL